MATTSTVCSSLVILAPGCAVGEMPAALEARKSTIRPLNLFNGLKAENKVMRLGVCVSTEQKFSELRAKCSAKSATGKGGAAGVKCDLAKEIFTVVPIMSALVLIGIAVGFLLLRVEAALEEDE